jgi:FkbM family methyltransferase
LSGTRGVFRCRLRRGPKLSIRPKPSRDYDTAYEIFLLRIYDTCLEPQSVRRIVDLGGNVGYSCLFWCWNYPSASVLTFEPHPVHCELLAWHLRENSCSDRVTLLPAAATTHPGRASLTDEDDASTIVVGAGSTRRDCQTLAIETLDVFEAIGIEPIDILKMDIEGSEYEIMSDSRFDALLARTRYVIVEWHDREAHHLGAAWCQERLARLGFHVEAGRCCGEFGILRGTRLLFADSRLCAGESVG